MNQPALSLEQHRERAITQLAELFAHDRMTLEELERRIDAVQRAPTVGALREATSDLPVRAAAPALDTRPVPSSAPPNPKNMSVVIALMSGTERRGGWAPARRLHATAVMGGIELDFRDARLAAGITDVFVTGIMGGVSIIVPPDLPVDIAGVAVMGGWEEPDDARHPSVFGEPDEYQGELRLLRIRGFAFMGGVEVEVRLPGETGRDASRRRREQRKLKRGRG